MRLCSRHICRGWNIQNIGTQCMPIFLLGCYAVDVAWEHGAFLDVGDAEEAGGDTLQADGEAAVRGHAVAEGI